MTETVLDRVTPLVSALADQLAELVQELVIAGVRSRLRAALDGAELYGHGSPVAPPSEKKKTKTIAPGSAKHAAAAKRGGHSCGRCGKPGHNRKTCPDQEDAAEPDLEPVPPPDPPRALVDVPPPPTAGTKSDRFARIQSAARARGVG